MTDNMKLRERFPFMKTHENDIPPGWLGLIIELFEKLSEFDDVEFSIVEIKEKFGSLRVYAAMIDGDTDKLIEIQRLIDACEERSGTICDECGEPGTPNASLGWIRTLCPGHRDARHGA